ncbi:MAG: hypothetical protein WEA04_04425 [Candidatus Andersenbacteria bacterium]
MLSSLTTRRLKQPAGHQQRGDIAIYMSLIMLAIIVSSAILFSIILARQIRATTDAISSERAFYAANSGLEQGLYELSLFAQESTPLTGAVEYGSVPDTSTAGYEGEAKYLPSDGITPCVQVTGRFPDGNAFQEERRLRLGPGECFTD